MKTYSTVQRQVEELTAAGKRQKEIAEILGLSRATVYRLQKRSGLEAWSMPDEATNKQILTMLRAGMSQKRIMETLDVTEHAVRRIAKGHHFRARVVRLTENQFMDLLKAVSDPRYRKPNDKLNVWRVSKQLAIPYKPTLRITNSILKCEKFIAHGKSPFMAKAAKDTTESNFLQMAHLIEQTCPLRWLNAIELSRIHAGIVLRTGAVAAKMRELNRAERARVEISFQENFLAAIMTMREAEGATIH
jgi:DNA-binding CsgD family transcriptional regulator